MIVACSFCNKKFDRKTKPTTKYNYCCVSHQMKNEYVLGIRDKNKITEKARVASAKKMSVHNWLNDISSRDKLKKIQQTVKYKLKSSLVKLGDKNPMFGKTGENAGHYKGGNYKKYGIVSRGACWKLIKKKIKLRDNYACRYCGIKESYCKQALQVHHIIPYKCTKDNSEDNLLTLCPKCHGKAEFKFFKVKEIKLLGCDEQVYNFSVEEDETYIANNLVVHNCRSSLTTPRIRK